MPRTPKQPKPKLVVDNAPPSHAANTVIAILPMEHGVFAWVVESPPKPRRPFNF